MATLIYIKTIFFHDKRNWYDMFYSKSTSIFDEVDEVWGYTFVTVMFCGSFDVLIAVSSLFFFFCVVGSENLMQWSSFPYL